MHLPAHGGERGEAQASVVVQQAGEEVGIERDQTSRLKCRGRYRIAAAHEHHRFGE